MSWANLDLLTRVEATIWFVGVGIGVFLAVFFFRLTRKAEFPQAKRFFLGLFMFAVTYSVARFIENVRKYFISDDLHDIVNAWAAGGQIQGINWVLRVLYYVIAWTGISIFYFHAERHVFQNKTKFVLTAASIGEGTVSILQYVFLPGSTGFNTCSMLAAVGFFIVGVFPVFLFFNLARTTTGDVRKYNATTGSGLVCFVAGVVADLPESGYLTGQTLPQWVTGIFAACLIFTGFILLAYSFRGLYASNS
ncbi:MAG: hypothetical protein ACTSU5_21835 [Promethearchaeota archaeon]